MEFFGQSLVLTINHDLEPMALQFFLL